LIFDLQRVKLKTVHVHHDDRRLMSENTERTTEDLLAPCGLDCGECPAYVATQANDASGLARVAEEWSRAFNFELTLEEVICDGCRTDSARKYAYIKTCRVRPCATARGVRTCAHCDDYGCDTLIEFFGNVPRTRELLEAIRAKL
jgi:hypothetical protein